MFQRERYGLRQGKEEGRLRLALFSCVEITMLKGPFLPSDFRATKFSTAADDAEFGNALLRFIESEFRAFTVNPCQHAALYDHGEPTGCLYPVPTPAAQPSSPEERFGVPIYPTTVRYQWEQLFAANGSTLLLEPADGFSPRWPETARALPVWALTPELPVREITPSAVRDNYRSNWAGSTGRSFPCWVSSQLR